jgi:hypothetical protein
MSPEPTLRAVRLFPRTYKSQDNRRRRVSRWNVFSLSTTGHLGTDLRYTGADLGYSTRFLAGLKAVAGDNLCPRVFHPSLLTFVDSVSCTCWEYGRPKNTTQLRGVDGGEHSQLLKHRSDLILDVYLGGFHPAQGLNALLMLNTFR